MPTPVSEVVVISCHPDSAVSDTLKEMYSILSRQSGFLGGHWGKWIENEDKVQLVNGKPPPSHYQSKQISNRSVIEWDDISSLINFHETPDFAALQSLTGTLLASPPEVHQVYFDPPLSTVLKPSASSVIEIVTFHSPIPTLDDKIKEFYNIKELSEVVGKAEGLRGVCKGTMVEETENASQYFVEWESVKAHEDANEIGRAHV